MRDGAAVVSFAAVPKNGQTWIICGGRDFKDTLMFESAMSDILSIKGCPEVVVHGAARGADTMADKWAERMALRCIAVPADWKSHGRSAGAIRNGEMIDKYRPDFVIAFPGGSGTADMVRRARKAKIDVCEVKIP